MKNIILIGGAPGSGKTTYASSLLNQNNSYLLFDIDEFRLKIKDLKLSREKEWRLFRNRYKELVDTGDINLIVVSTFLERNTRDFFYNYGLQRNCRIQAYFITQNIHILMNRCRLRKHKFVKKDNYMSVLKKWFNRFVKQDNSDLKTRWVLVKSSDEIKSKTTVISELTRN